MANVNKNEILKDVLNESKGGAGGDSEAELTTVTETLVDDFAAHYKPPEEIQLFRVAEPVNDAKAKDAKIVLTDVKTDTDVAGPSEAIGRRTEIEPADYSGVPLAIRRRLKARSEMGQPNLSKGPKPLVEAATDQTTPVFNYHSGAESGMGEKSDRSEQDGTSEQVGILNQPVSSPRAELAHDEPITAQAEKPEEKPEEGGKLVDMAEINPSGKEENETDSAKPPTNFETTDDAESVLGRSQAGKSDQGEHFWEKLHKPSVPNKPTPVELRAEELRRGEGSQPVIEVSDIRKEDPESAHKNPAGEGEAPVAPFLAKPVETEEPRDLRTEGQDAAEQLESNAGDMAEVIGGIEDGKIIQSAEAPGKTESQGDPRITIDQKEGPKNERNEEQRTGEHDTVERQGNGIVAQKEEKRQGFWARLFGGKNNSHPAHEIASSSGDDLTTDKIASLTTTRSPEKQLDEAA